MQPTAGSGAGWLRRYGANKVAHLRPPPAPAPAPLEPGGLPGRGEGAAGRSPARRMQSRKRATAMGGRGGKSRRSMPGGAAPAAPCCSTCTGTRLYVTHCTDFSAAAFLLLWAPLPGGAGHSHGKSGKKWAAWPLHGGHVSEIRSEIRLGWAPAPPFAPCARLPSFTPGQPD